MTHEVSVDRRSLLKGAGGGAGGLAVGALLRPSGADAVSAPGGVWVIGAWYVDAVGAPFRPHLFAFHGDRTVLTTNPDAGDANTSDSMGLGPWAVTRDGSVFGAFEQINADRDTHQYVSRLRVEFTVRLQRDGGFTGPAIANYYNPDGSPQAGPFPATLNGEPVGLPAAPTV